MGRNKHKEAGHLMFKIEYQVDGKTLWCSIARTFDTREEAEKYVHQELSSFAHKARILECKIIKEWKVLLV